MVFKLGRDLVVQIKEIDPENRRKEPGKKEDLEETTEKGPEGCHVRKLTYLWQFLNLRKYPSPGL